MNDYCLTFHCEACGTRYQTEQDQCSCVLYDIQYDGEIYTKRGETIKSAVKSLAYELIEENKDYDLLTDILEFTVIDNHIEYQFKIFSYIEYDVIEQKVINK